MFQPNAVIAGRYQVVRLVGQGGMSNLYLAYDRKYNNATVVVKEMTASYSDPKEQQMAVDLFHREAKLLASLNHRHIPKVYDYFQFAGKYYLSMEYIDGVDLAIKLEEKKGPLPEKQVLEWGEQIATVLFYLHKHDPPIVFRDVKPSNIMISSKGVKLIDFGIARHFDQAKKGDTMRIGSPGYAPPEQYAAQTDPRSDIYALGVTLHHALTGRDPTATNTPFLVPPARDLNPALSESTAAMLSRATQLDPSDRYQSALEMKKDIKHILNRNQQSTRVVGAPPALPAEAQSKAPDADDKKSKKSNKAAAAAAAAASVAAATAAAAGSAVAAAAPSGSGSGTAATSGQSGNLSSGQTGTGAGSGSLAATASPSPTGSGSLTTPKAKNKGGSKGKFLKFLLAAAIFTLSAGATAFFLSSEEQRQKAWETVSQYARSFVQELKAQDDPETKLRDALVSGTPESLIPLLQSSDFKSLSEEKQELFRLDLLAVSNQKPRRVLHILVPREQDKPEVWKVAAQVVASINSRGGLGRELLVVVPEYYTSGTLAHKLGRLTSEQSSNKQSFLVLGAEQESLDEKLAQKALFLTSQEMADRPSVTNLSQSNVPWNELFGLSLGPDSPPTVWGIPGPTPGDAIDSDKALTAPLSAESISALLQQADQIGGRVVARAEDVQAADGSNQKGKLHLLATTPGQLPKLGSQTEGTASVLSSPFEETELESPVHIAPLDNQPLTLQQARLFDSIILAGLSTDKAYQGLTVTRKIDGSYQPKKTIKYRWTGKSWLPSLPETGKSE